MAWNSWLRSGKAKITTDTWQTVFTHFDSDVLRNAIIIRATVTRARHWIITSPQICPYFTMIREPAPV